MLLQQLDYSILQQCIHCGMCLPTCPTYDATKRETSSPRGRIALMRAVADGKLGAHSPQFADEMYFCLGCLACETACPAGVDYANMLESARAEVGVKGGRLLRWLFTKPTRLRAVARLLRHVNIPPAMLPGRLREMYDLRPRIRERFSFDLIREVERPATVHYRVGLLTGCVQDVAFSDVNRDTVDVLLANGCEVFTPRGQVCCGSLMGHNGELRLARRLALQNIETFEPEKLDAIIANSAGCGSFMKRYRHLLPDEPRAKVWDGKIHDIHEWLAKIGIRPASGAVRSTTVTYHDACHLVHGQSITQQPRELLRAIPGVELVELPEAAWCCGSAGLYNITRPEMSMALLERKMKHIAATGAQVVATGNPGCIGQLRYGAKRYDVNVQVVHPVTLLARAYRR
ncbi:MAG TPA: (Fe-S)-binding protein [Verrucomicrobiae bacterium]|nr:(Fe-S)-binding protein [Verrucomicrobiae bacterium]